MSLLTATAPASPHGPASPLDLNDARGYSHWTWGPFRSPDHRRAVNRRYAAVDG